MAFKKAFIFLNIYNEIIKIYTVIKALANILHLDNLSLFTSLSHCRIEILATNYDTV